MFEIYNMYLNYYALIIFVILLIYRCRNLSEYMKIAEKVKEFFHNEGIHSTTIQPEFVEIPGEGYEVSIYLSIFNKFVILHIIF